MSETTTTAPAATTSAPDASIDAAQIAQPVGNAPEAEGSTTEVTPGAPPKDGKVTDVKKDANPENPEKPYTIRVSGKNYNVSLEEALTLAQKGVGADAKFGEATRMRQQAEQVIHLLKTNPMAILNNPNLGLDFKKLAQDFLEKEINREMMTPAERELAEIKEKLAAAENEKKTLAEKESAEREKQLVDHYSAEYEKDIQTTLASSGLPKTRGTVKRLAYYMQKGLERGVELKAGDVVDLVRADYIQEHNELYGNTDGDTLLKMFGDPIIKKLMEANLKRVKGGGNVPTPSMKTNPSNVAPSSEQKMDKDEWRKNLDAHVSKL